MSVKTWKKIISIFVIILILSLAILTLFLGIGYFRYEKLLNAPTTVDLTTYGYTDSESLSKLFKYLKEVDADETISYQSKYEHLNIDNDFNFTADTDEKVCYLTFDDGPNKDVTPEILDILDRYNVKATFFVIYRDNEEEKKLYKRIINEGHTIGIHSASHNYTKIYASVDAYLDDFCKISDHVEALTGSKPEIFRFPGGSVNSYNKAIYQRIIAEMTRRGYVYYDWNYSSGDAESANISPSEITDNVLKYNLDSSKMIVLCHDGPGHQNTAKALPDVIEDLLAQGYTLKALDNTVSPICFGY